MRRIRVALFMMLIGGAVACGGGGSEGTADAVDVTATGDALVQDLTTGMDTPAPLDVKADTLNDLHGSDLTPLDVTDPGTDVAPDDVVPVDLVVTPDITGEVEVPPSIFTPVPNLTTQLVGACWDGVTGGDGYCFFSSGNGYSYTIGDATEQNYCFTYIIDGADIAFDYHEVDGLTCNNLDDENAVLYGGLKTSSWSCGDEWSLSLTCFVAEPGATQAGTDEFVGTWRYLTTWDERAMDSGGPLEVNDFHLTLSAGGSYTLSRTTTIGAGAPVTDDFTGTWSYTNDSGLQRLALECSTSGGECPFDGSWLVMTVSVDGVKRIGLQPFYYEYFGD